MAPRGPQDSVFKSSGHITGASGFSPKTWPGKILLMSWTWYLGWSRMVPKGPNNWDICGNIMEYIYILWKKLSIYLSLHTYIPTFIPTYHCSCICHACIHTYIHTFLGGCLLGFPLTLGYSILYTLGYSGNFRSICLGIPKYVVL